MHDLLKVIALRYLPVSLLRRHFAKTTTQANPTINMKKQLLVDVSVIAKEDAKTGIQRVVRNLYQELLATPPTGYQILPIAAARKQGYCYLPKDFLQQPINNQISASIALEKLDPVKVNAGDLFLALDLAAHIIPHRISELLSWKRQGVRMCFFVYDLLPVIEPKWFNPKTSQNFKRWLRAMAILADDVIAISRSVQADLTVWMKKNYGQNERDIPCATIQLGTGLNLLSNNQINSLPAELIQKKFILMVGTIEPRKGHADVLEAFEQLWAAGDYANLVVAGKQGWRVELYMHRLLNHHELGKRLYWFNSPSDEVLQALYRQCSGLIMASKGEGFGLPLTEAAIFNKSILARDIPVFREVAGDIASYFSSTEKNGLTEILPQWLMKLEQNGYLPVIYPACVPWRESCEQLLRTLKLTKDIFDGIALKKTEGAANESQIEVGYKYEF